jgi:methyl-accepting chemotaxis protein
MGILNRYVILKLFFPVGLLFAVGVIVAIWAIPAAYEANARGEAINAARKTVEQFKTIRAYYTKNVIKKVLAESSLKPSFNHKTEPKGVPLPATMIHDLSELLAEKGTTLKLYSPFPFPNRQARGLDDFGTNAWKALENNPDQPFVESFLRDGETWIRVGIADTMASEVCVGCHNSHPQTPKNDWKLNDLRGVLEVSIPISEQLAHGRTMSYQIVGGILVTLMLILILGWAIYHQAIASRLNNLVEAMENIAEGDGDLTRRMQVSGEDELARIGRAFNRFAEIMRSDIHHISGTADNIFHLAEESKSAYLETSEGMHRQQSETDMVATAMNQMAASVDEISRTAASASEAAKSADNHVKDGKQVVSQAAASINDLANQVEQVGEVINRLEADSENIGSVLDVIRGIAEQTNLLALNAAIEAARAGEQGRGFAVVADEVRTLANRTQQSTEEIQEMIARLQAGSRNAVSAMDRGREQTQSSVEHTRKVSETLDAIAQAVSTIHDMNVSVASATEEQSAVSQEVNRNITSIHDVTVDHVRATQRVAATNEQLASVSDQLKQLVNRYKT